MGIRDLANMYKEEIAPNEISPEERLSHAMQQITKRNSLDSQNDLEKQIDALDTLLTLDSTPCCLLDLAMKR